MSVFKFAQKAPECISDHPFPILFMGGGGGDTLPGILLLVCPPSFLLPPTPLPILVPVSWTSERTNGLSSGWSRRKLSPIFWGLPDRNFAHGNAGQKLFTKIPPDPFPKKMKGTELQLKPSAHIANRYCCCAILMVGPGTCC